jgi:hypothetical protein
MRPLRYSAAELLVALALLSFSASFVGDWPSGGLTEVGLVALGAKGAGMLVAMEPIAGLFDLPVLISRLVVGYAAARPPLVTQGWGARSE